MDILMDITMQELLVPCRDREGRILLDYYATKYGNIYSFKSFTPKRIGALCGPKGNKRFHVTLEGKLIPVYRVIAHTFLGPPPSYPGDSTDVHHIDGNSNCNAACNLEYLPHKEHVKMHTSGENHHQWGKSHSPEMRKRLSDANKGKKMSVEARQKLSTANRGTMYISDGIVTKRVPVGAPIPFGWTRGITRK